MVVCGNARQRRACPGSRHHRCEGDASRGPSPSRSTAERAPVLDDSDLLVGIVSEFDPIRHVMGSDAGKLASFPVALEKGGDLTVLPRPKARVTTIYHPSSPPRRMSEPGGRRPHSRPPCATHSDPARHGAGRRRPAGRPDEGAAVPADAGTGATPSSEVADDQPASRGRRDPQGRRARRGGFDVGRAGVVHLWGEVHTRSTTAFCRAAAPTFRRQGHRLPSCRRCRVGQIAPRLEMTAMRSLYPCPAPGDRHGRAGIRLVASTPNGASPPAQIMSASRSGPCPAAPRRRSARHPPGGGLQPVVLRRAPDDGGHAGIDVVRLRRRGNKLAQTVVPPPHRDPALLAGLLQGIHGKPADEAQACGGTNAAAPSSRRSPDGRATMLLYRPAAGR